MWCVVYVLISALSFRFHVVHQEQKLLCWIAPRPIITPTSYQHTRIFKISEVASLSNLNIYSSSHYVLHLWHLDFHVYGMGLFSDTGSLIPFIIQLVVSDSASVLLPEH